MVLSNKFTIEITNGCIVNTLVLHGRDYTERWTEKLGVLTCLSYTIGQQLDRDESVNHKEIHRLREAIDCEDIQAMLEGLRALE